MMDDPHNDMLEFLKEDAINSRNKRHQNQVNLVLKNKYNQLANQCLENDPLNSGYLNYEKLDTIIKKYFVELMRD